MTEIVKIEIQWENVVKVEWENRMRKLREKVVM